MTAVICNTCKTLQFIHNLRRHAVIHRKQQKHKSWPIRVNTSSNVHCRVISAAMIFSVFDVLFTVCRTWQLRLYDKQILPIAPLGTSSAWFHRRTDARWRAWRTVPGVPTSTGGSFGRWSHRQGWTWSYEGRARLWRGCALWLWRRRNFNSDYISRQRRRSDDR